MNENTKSYLISIVASLTIIWGTEIISRLARTLPTRRLWRLVDPKTLYICISTSAKTDTGEYTRFSTGIGQIRALAIIAPSLHRAYKEFDVQRVLMSEDKIADRCEGDLIILGGPKNNSVAQKIMTLLKPHLPGFLSEPGIVWSENGSRIKYAAIMGYFEQSLETA